MFLEIQQLLDPALDDQESSWMSGDRMPVEDFLRREPVLRNNAEAVLDLIYHEYTLRRRLGEQPDPNEFIARFPDLGKPLMIQLGIDAAIPASTNVLGGKAGANFNAYSPCGSIGAYEILAELGRGGMGVVYKCRDADLDRVVAVKTIAAGQNATAEQRARFDAEARAVARLEHPHIIAIHAVGHHDGVPYLSLEFAEGGSLSQRLSRGPMPCPAAGELIETVARAVHAAHQAGVIHRDLKPSNVLFAADGAPKVADFGLAKLLDDNSGRTLSGEPVGTPSYMSPEQADGRVGSIGPAADVYALGATLYHALSGRPPFLGQSAVETLSMVMSADAVPPRRLRPDIPRDLETICLRCLERLPSNRYESAAALAQDLRRFLDGRPTLARPVRLPVRLWRWCRRNPKLAAVTASFAATLLMAVSVISGLIYRHNLQLRMEIARTRAKEDEARGSYREAQAALRKILARHNEPRFAGVPRLVELRREQRQDVLSFYESVLGKMTSSDAVVRADTARAFSEASMLQHELGHSDQAEISVGRAILLYEGLRAEGKWDLELAARAAECLMRRGIYLLGLKRLDEAITVEQEAVKQAEAVVDADPDNMLNRELLAVCHHDLGTAFWTAGRKDDAKSHFRKAIEIREAIDPLKVIGLESSLAEALINDGVVYWHEKQPDHAEKRFRRAEELLRSVPNERRDALHNDTALAQVDASRSGMLVENGKYAAAIVRTDAGLKRVEHYLQTEPNDELVRTTCLALHGNRAYALMGQEKFNDAAKEWTRVIELSGDKVPADYRIKLALVLLYAGQVAASSEQAEFLKSADGISADDRYNLGCIFALSAALVQKDGKLPADKRSRQAEKHVGDALWWLKSAADAGFFRDPKQREHAKKDEDLKILWDRDEFRRIVDQVDDKK